MSITSIGGPQGPQEQPKGNQPKVEKDHTAEINQKIQQYFNSAANAETINNKIDTEKETNIFNNAINVLRNKFPGAAAIIDKAIENLTGGNKTQQPTETQPVGTSADVQGATSEDTPVDSSYRFDNNGNVESDITNNDDGSKDIKFGDETIHVSQNGDSITVTNESGRNVALVKTPDGGYEFTDEDGEKHRFDKDMNPLD